MCCCSQAPEVVIHLKCKGDHPWKQGPKGRWRECPQGHCHVTCWHCWLGGSVHRLGRLSSSGWHGVKSTSLGSDANFSSPDCFSGKCSSPDPSLSSSLWQQRFAHAGLCPATHQELLCQAAATGLSPCTELAALPTEALLAARFRH